MCWISENPRSWADEQRHPDGEANVDLLPFMDFWGMWLLPRLMLGASRSLRSSDVVYSLHTSGENSVTLLHFLCFLVTEPCPPLFSFCHISLRHCFLVVEKNLLACLAIMF